MSALVAIGEFNRFSTRDVEKARYTRNRGFDIRTLWTYEELLAAAFKQ
jgi:hypothetical protein